jgi:hypothetical protein
LNKHIEKLLSNDPRLYSLSQESDSNQKNLCFGQCHSEYKVPDASRVQDLDSLSDDHQFRQQILEETVPMSVGVNAEVKYHDGPQNYMAILNPSPGTLVITERLPSEPQVVFHAHVHRYPKLFENNLLSLGKKQF